MKNWPIISLLLLAPLAVALSLTSCNHKTATLKLVINGPYAICEQDSRHLLLLMPDLISIPEPSMGHWPPGFSADFSEIPLIPAGLSSRSNFELELGRSGASSPKISKGNAITDFGLGPVVIDSIADQRPCTGVTAQYISLTIPMPDRMCR